MANLIADKYTVAEHKIATTDGKYTLYVQQWGNPDGTPIVFLHGGPGNGCSQSHKALFDPQKHHVIFIDQRGSGLSTPVNSIEANTTQLLISDIEQIRIQFGLNKIALFGRSWGSTLALCYAIAQPNQVSQIVTGGVFLGTVAEDEWLTKHVQELFFPEVWDNYGDNADTLLKYARLTLPTLRLDDRYEEIDVAEFDESQFSIERQYAKHQWYIPNNYILDNAHLLTMPITIIQGRYDMMTPPKSAYTLHKAAPHSTLLWTIAGHAGSDRANFDAAKALLAQL